MAREVVIKSDLSDTPGARTYTLTFDGEGYEIDLIEAEAEPLLAVFKQGRAIQRGSESPGRGVRSLERRIRNAPEPPEE